MMNSLEKENEETYRMISRKDKGFGKNVLSLSLARSLVETVCMCRDIRYINTLRMITNRTGARINDFAHLIPRAAPVTPIG